MAGLLPFTAASAAEPGPSELVATLYKVQAAAQKKGPRPDEKGQREKFFDKHIVELLEADEKLASKEGVGRLDFDPFYDGQDFKIVELRVGEAAIAGDGARVIVNYKNLRTPQRLTYELTRQAGIWRISNIFSENTEIKWDLVSVLTREMPSN